MRTHNFATFPFFSGLGDFFGVPGFFRFWGVPGYFGFWGMYVRTCTMYTVVRMTYMMYIDVRVYVYDVQWCTYIRVRCTLLYVCMCTM